MTRPGVILLMQFVSVSFGKKIRENINLHNIHEGLANNFLIRRISLDCKAKI